MRPLLRLCSKNERNNVNIDFLNDYKKKKNRVGSELYMFFFLCLLRDYSANYDRSYFGITLRVHKINKNILQNRIFLKNFHKKYNINIQSKLM